MKKIIGTLLSILGSVVGIGRQPSGRPYSPDIDNYRQAAGSSPGGF
ncbi:hypothetical protein OG535_01095 [Kitasatospora sp. NBC_00085]